MDGPTFDVLTRSLSTTRSRRRAVVAELTGVLGQALASAGEDAAAKKKKPCPPCKKRKQGKCKKKLPDGTACGGGTCQSGSCVPVGCPSGQKLCAGTCIASGLCCNNAECPADRPICYDGSCDPCLPIYTFGVAQNCESSAQCCGTASGVPAVCCQISAAGPVCFDFLINTTACAPANECPPQQVDNCLNYQPDRTCVNGVCI